MELEEVRRRVGMQREELSALGVESLMVCGSVARHEEEPGSGVDMLVEFSRPMGLFGLIRFVARIRGFGLLGSSTPVEHDGNSWRPT
ncbi:MAG: nucleotidyltransferase [Planctomycetes bacterium]|nr:nucleotidyltransferase [Planctomycetota bacterium]